MTKRTGRKRTTKPAIRKTLPRLREPEHSAFTHQLWHRYDFIRLMQWSAKGLDLHHEQLGKYTYSAVQDAFYALAGLTPNDSPAGKAWANVQDTPDFEDLQGLMKDQFGASAAVVELASQFEKFMMQPPDEEQAKQEDAAQEEKEEAAAQDQEQEKDDNGDESDDESGKEQGQDGQDDDKADGDDGEGQGGDEDEAGDGSGDGDQEQESDDGESDEQGSGQGGQPGPAGEKETIEADARAGRGVIKPSGDRSTARKVVNAKMVEGAKDEAVAVETVYSFLTEPTAERERVAHEILDLDLLSMKSLVNFLGWMKRVVKGARRRGRAAVGEFTGYRPGAWSSNTHPMEMAQVAKGNPIYMARMVENQLTNRIYKEDRPLGKGPVVVLRDESDSMVSEHMFIDNKNISLHQAALSFEVALAQVMNTERRDLVSIAWSSSGTRQYTYGEKGMEEHWGSFEGGGTRIEPALEKALGVAKEYVSGADFLVITDGDLQMDPRSANTSWNAHCVELLEEFRERGGRVWAICINARPQDMSHKLAWMDGWVSIEDIRAGEKVADLLEKMSADRLKPRGRVAV